MILKLVVAITFALILSADRSSAAAQVAAEAPASLTTQPSVEAQEFLRASIDRIALAQNLCLRLAERTIETPAEDDGGPLVQGSAWESAIQIFRTEAGEFCVTGNSYDSAVRAVLNDGKIYVDAGRQGRVYVEEMNGKLATDLFGGDFLSFSTSYSDPLRMLLHPDGGRMLQSLFSNVRFAGYVAVMHENCVRVVCTSPLGQEWEFWIDNKPPNALRRIIVTGISSMGFATGPLENITVGKVVPMKFARHCVFEACALDEAPPAGTFDVPPPPYESRPQGFSPAAEAVGLSVSDFEFIDLNGHNVNLATKRDQIIVLVNIVAVSERSISALGTVTQLCARFAGQDVVVLGINAKDDAATCKQLALKAGVPESKIILDPESRATSKLGASRGRVYVVNRAGTVVYQGGASDIWGIFGIYDAVEAATLEKP